MTTIKAKRLQALSDATASIRLEGLPVFDSDDDLYADAIEGHGPGSTRDAVLGRIREELQIQSDEGPAQLLKTAR